jgi:hypothetical protein
MDDRAADDDDDKDGNISNDLHEDTRLTLD